MIQEKHLTQYRACSLLFWQYLVLGAVCGVFFLSFPFHAAVCLGLLLLFSGMHYQDSRCFRLVLIAAVFLLACVWAAWREPVQSPENIVWYQENFNPLEKQEICGKIEQVQGVHNRRLRIVLSHVHKKEANPCPHTGKSLQGNVIFTWDNAPDSIFNENPRPVAGQYLQVKTALRPFYGALQKYYERQNAWYGAWHYGQSGGKNKIQLAGEGNFWSRIREDLRQDFVQVLFGQELLPDKLQPAMQSCELQKTVQGTEHSAETVFVTDEGQAKAVLLALLFGDKFYLTQDTLECFAEANLSHSLALSGQHLSLAGVLACFLLVFVSWLKPRVYLQVPKQHLFVFLGFVLGFLYCWLGSSPYSLLRAYIMASFAGLLYVWAKHISLLDLLFYALILFICFDPLALCQLGVQLSFCSVFAIAFLLPFLRYLHAKYFLPFRPGLRKILFVPFSLLLVSCVVQIALTPLLLLYFGRISWFSLLNIIWLPLLAFWVMPVALAGFLCMGFSFAPSLLALAYEPVVYFIRGLNWITTYCHLEQGIRPMGLACLGFYLLFLLCIFSLRSFTQKSRVFLGIAIFLLFAPVFLRFVPFGQGVQLTLFDVGNGQAAAIQTAEKHLLLDVGGTSSKRFNAGRDIVAQKLTQNQFPHFDAVIASHDDSDHINGIAPVVQAFSVQQFYETGWHAEKKSYAKKALEKVLARCHVPVSTLGRGDFLDLGSGYGLEVLYPPKNTESPWALAEYSQNNSSLVMRLVKNGHGIALFCGDAEKEALEKLTAMHKQNIHSLQADILVLPHHGSENSYAEEFYDLVNPRYVLASCGKNNRFHFPAQIVRDYFARKNVVFLTTADQGDIVFIHQDGQIFLNRKTFLQACYSIL